MALDASISEKLSQDEIIGRIATGLYNLASMLVGAGEESAVLVEKTVAAPEVSLCCCAKDARRSAKRVLANLAIRQLGLRDPESLKAPDGPLPKDLCIEDDDLDSAGLTTEELEKIFAGPERERVRNWLEGLKPAIRIVFVLRAVATLSAAETARALKVHGGAHSMGWTEAHVRQSFREGLCSLASQILHAAHV